MTYCSCVAKAQGDNARGHNMSASIVEVFPFCDKRLTKSSAIQGCVGPYNGYFCLFSFNMGGNQSSHLFFFPPLLFSHLKTLHYSLTLCDSTHSPVCLIYYLPFTFQSGSDTSRPAVVSCVCKGVETWSRTKTE